MVLVYRDDERAPMKFLSAEKYSIDDSGILHVHNGDDKVVASFVKWIGAVIATEETVLRSA